MHLLTCLVIPRPNFITWMTKYICTNLISPIPIGSILVARRLDCDLCAMQQFTIVTLVGRQNFMQTVTCFCWRPLDVMFPMCNQLLTYRIKSQLASARLKTIIMFPAPFYMMLDSLGLVCISVYNFGSVQLCWIGCVVRLLLLVLLFNCHRLVQMSPFKQYNISQNSLYDITQK